ncbi:hypothetical protein UlMin_024851 [Ulmus minor]
MLKRFIQSSKHFFPFMLSSRGVQGGSGSPSGLNCALAGKGVIVSDKVFKNLKSFELEQQGATVADALSGLPIRVRGNVSEGAYGISKVTSHISSISNVFVHDGAIGSSPICNAKVRVISDSPSAVLSLSNLLWETHNRAVSHDSCPLTVYVATSISPGVGEIIGLGSQETNGFIAADVERSSLVLCGKAFSDTNGTIKALAALSEPIICARGGLSLSARLLVVGDSVILLFAPENTFKSCANKLVSPYAGVILSSQGLSTLFRNGSSGGSNLFKFPASVILASSDSSGIIPRVSKLCPEQAAYHFLAGYRNGNFVPAYSKGPSSIDPLELAKALLSELKENQISSFLVNVKEGEKRLTGKDFIELVASTLNKNIPPFEVKDNELEGKYKRFLSGKFQDLPEVFCF